jgi:hypothetical protein
MAGAAARKTGIGLEKGAAGQQNPPFARFMPRFSG